MFADSALPILRALVPERSLDMRTWRLASLGESQLEQLVGAPLLALGLELGYCARPGEVDLRTIGTPAQLEAAAAIVERALADHIVSLDAQSLEQVIVAELTARGATLATAESCTGGYLAHRLTNVPGASAVFTHGYVTYANEAKESVLCVPAELLAKHGAVSREVASAMAEGALERGEASFALATTGIAGPSGATAEKPLGTVHLALAERGQPTKCEHHVFATDRGTFKELASQSALDLLRRALRSSRS